MKLQEGSKKVFSKHILGSQNLSTLTLDLHLNIPPAPDLHLKPTINYTTARATKMDFGAYAQNLSHCHLLLGIPLPSGV